MAKKRTARKKRSMKLRISENKYKQLISMKKRKQPMSKKDKKILDDSLYIKYCKCLKQFKFSENRAAGYPICMNAVYKKRNITPPKNASTRCNALFNKNIGK